MTTGLTKFLPWDEFRTRAAKWGIGPVTLDLAERQASIDDDREMIRIECKASISAATVPPFLTVKRDGCGRLIALLS
jgi:hypothetical protein